MDQVYRIGRRLGKLMLALLMVVSLFDLTSLFANDETNAPAKVIQLCDEENIQSTEDGELLIHGAVPLKQQMKTCCCITIMKIRCRITCMQHLIH